MIWPQKKSERKPDTELPEITLDGFRVYMRPPRSSDVRAWIGVRNRNRDFLKPFEPTWDDNCLTEGYFNRRLSRQLYEWNAGLGNSFLIFKKDNHELIGGMNINHICRGAGQYASLGYWIDEGHQGQGYMAESLRLTLKYAFEELDLHRVHAACIVKNERSKNLLLRGGFKEEGFAPRYICIDGAWQDHYLFGITLEDWQKSEKF